MSNTYIFLLFDPIICMVYYLINLIWLGTMIIEKCRKTPLLPCEKRITKTNERTNGVITHYVLKI